MLVCIVVLVRRTNYTSAEHTQLSTLVYLVLGPVPRRVEVRGALQVPVRDLVRRLRRDNVHWKLDFQELVTGVPANLETTTTNVT